MVTAVRLQLCCWIPMHFVLRLDVPFDHASTTVFNFITLPSIHFFGRRSLSRRVCSFGMGDSTLVEYIQVLLLVHPKDNWHLLS